MRAIIIGAGRGERLTPTTADEPKCFADSTAGDTAVLSELREDFEIGLGCVSVTPGRVDEVETIAGRVEEALRFVAPERITLNGSASDPYDGPARFTHPPTASRSGSRTSRPRVSSAAECSGRALPSG